MHGAQRRPAGRAAASGRLLAATTAAAAAPRPVPSQRQPAAAEVAGGGGRQIGDARAAGTEEQPAAAAAVAEGLGQRVQPGAPLSAAAVEECCCPLLPGALPRPTSANPKHSLTLRCVPCAAAGCGCRHPRQQQGQALDRRALLPADPHGAAGAWARAGASRGGCSRRGGVLWGWLAAAGPHGAAGGWAEQREGTTRALGGAGTLACLPARRAADRGPIASPSLTMHPPAHASCRPQMRGTVSPSAPWDVMVDMFFYREPGAPSIVCVPALVCLHS